MSAEEKERERGHYITDSVLKTIIKWNVLTYYKRGDITSVGFHLNRKRVHLYDKIQDPLKKRKVLNSLLKENTCRNSITSG